MATMPDARVAVGGTVGSYVLEARLGKGGFGEVFRARHELTRKAVALKILAQWMTSDEQLVTRFFREASLGNQIAHPHVVEAFDAGRWEGHLFIAMELLDGVSLEQEIMLHGAMPVARALPILAQIAEALAAVHAHGVVHRDVKAGNIFLCAGDFVKLLDFGIAKLLGGKPQDGLVTDTGAVFGSPYTMSPEQCVGAAVDHRSDLYSLGAVAFHLLSGRHPFAGAPGEIISAHVRDAPPPVPDVEPALSALVRRMMDKDPAARPQTAAEVQRALVALAAGRPVAAPAPGWSGPVVGMATIAAVIAAVVVGGRLIARRAPARPPPTLPAVVAAPPPSPRAAPVVVAPVEARPARAARLIVNVRPWGAVRVDGGHAAEAPCSLLLVPGAHRVLVENPSLRRRSEQKLNLQPGETRRIDLDWRE